MRLNYEGKPPGYRKAGALPTGGRKNTAGRSAWAGGAVSFARRRSFDMVQPVQEGVHSLPSGANPGMYHH